MSEKMNWKETSTSFCHFPEWYHAEKIIYDAYYRCKLIDRNIINLALEKIKRVKNGS